MKRTLAFLLILLLLPAAALANSWGLKGDLLSAVMADDRWDDYTTMCDQVGNVAAMKSRYHHALMLVSGRNAPLQVYTRALWQPTDHRDDPTLTKSGNGFVLSYGKNERYTFAPCGDSFMLTAAKIGDFTMTLTGNDSTFTCTGDGQSAEYYIYGGVTLEKFSIRLLPRSVEEVRRFNVMRRALDSGSDILGWYEDSLNPGRLYSPGKKGTIPVYGAPSEDAWRAGSGKAAVSTNGEIYVLREWVAEDGTVWLHIRYEVSQRTHRFGFIKASQLPGYKVVGSDAYPQIAVPVRVAEMTALTDDPLLSQYGQHVLLPGTELTAIGMLGDEYALVQTEISGKPAWLFVPLKDLTPVMGEPVAEVMARLVGCWEFWAGGSMSLDYLRFYPDGTFCNPAWPAQGGTYTVTAYDAAQGKYWDNPDYELTLLYDDGAVTMRGLSFGAETDYDGTQMECFSLTNWEGGGGYIRINEADVPHWDTPDGGVG
ncbi:MAG: hypothetical protein IJE07_10445 [Clostridia bacterium]|nr:hypothetical protein [Clostridia bacterium]